MSLPRPVRLSIVAVYLVAIAVVSHDPSPPVPPLGFEGADKLLHALAYGVLGWLWAWALGGRRPATAAAVGFLAAAAYGVTDEVHQAFVPSRDASALDWLADAAGAGAGATLWWVRKKRAVRSSSGSGPPIRELGAGRDPA